MTSSTGIGIVSVAQNTHDSRAPADGQTSADSSQDLRRRLAQWLPGRRIRAATMTGGRAQQTKRTHYVRQR